MASRATYPNFKAWNASNNLLVGGKLYTYVPGTTTDKETYTDAAGTTPHTNPIVLDSLGESEIFLNGDTKFVLKDSNDVQIWSRDYVEANAVGGDNVDNIAALRLKTGSVAGALVNLLSHTTFGDGGAGKFLWYDSGAASTYTDNNGTIILPTGGDGSAAFLRDYSEAINVRWFGATGDGVTDDTAAIQAAIDSITSGALYFPKGSYLVSQNVSAGLDAMSQAAAAYRCLKITANDITLIAEKGASLVVDDSVSLGSPLITLYVTGNRFRLDGLTAKGTTGSKPSSGGVGGIYLYGSDNSLVNNAEVAYMSDAGVRIEGCTDTHVKNSLLYDCLDTAFNGFGGNLRCSIEGSTVSGSGDGNCTFYANNTHCAIRGCYLYGATQVGVIESGDRCIIENCTFDGTDGITRNGPIMNRCRQSSIKNNRIYKVQNGIVVRETDVADAGGVPNWSVQVTGNEISDIQEQGNVGQPVVGVLLEYSTNVLIANNTFFRAQKTGTGAVYEIQLQDRDTASAAGAKLENIRIVNNTFMLKHANFGVGSYNDYHTVVKNSTGYSLSRLSFDGNTVIAAGNHGTSTYLLDLGSVDRFSMQGNTFSDTTLAYGPANVLDATITSGIISGNIMPYYAASAAGPCLNIPGASRVNICNNFAGYANQANPGSFIITDSTATRCTIANNTVYGCSRFIASDTTPSLFSVLGNMVEYDLASQYLNVTPAIDANNTFTNY